LAQGKRFILSLEAKNSFMDYNLAPNDQISLAIGPERGWTAQEEELLESQNFQKVFLGPSVLRVEIATFAALGQLAMMRAKS
jgi:16S rRNA (uracil1498-N3)-methyltransferase